MQVLSRWRETAETEKDKIADTAETEKDEIADTAMRVHRDCKTTRQKRGYTEPVYRGLRQTWCTESQETVTCTETVRDCNMYRDCTSSPRAKRL